MLCLSVLPCVRQGTPLKNVFMNFIHIRLKIDKQKHPGTTRNILWNHKS